MNRFKMLLIGAALMTAGSALATAQSYDHDGRGFRGRDRYQNQDRDHERRFYGNRDDRRFFRNRDDRRFVGDRDDRRFFDRDERRYFAGERRFFNGYYWNWDGQRWYRQDGRAVFYFRF